MVNFRQAFLRAAEAQILRVWGLVRSEGPLAADEQRLASILLAHPEWQRHWDGKARVAASAEFDLARNPFLHVHLEYLVEQQAAEKKPAAVTALLDGAGSRPARRRERVQALLPVLWSCLSDALKDGRPFDEEEYVREIKSVKG
jgi:hypothetical protein